VHGLGIVDEVVWNRGPQGAQEPPLLLTPECFRRVPALPDLRAMLRRRVAEVRAEDFENADLFGNVLEDLDELDRTRPVAARADEQPLSDCLTEEVPIRVAESVLEEVSMEDRYGFDDDRGVTEYLISRMPKCLPPVPKGKGPLDQENKLKF